MEIPDLLTLYFPSYSEIPASQVRTTRQRLEALQHAAFPDIDYRPGSPLGDMGLTPFAYLFAGVETAVGRFMSDLDLLNVSRNEIYNCEYVRRYLGNFAVTDRATLQSSGVVRFTFVEDKDYVLDRRARYQFDASIFNLRMANPGHFLIRPVGAALVAGTNARNLVDIGGGLYGVDIPLIGIMTAAVLAGAAATTDYPIAELASVIALMDFDFGLPPASLAVLAEKTRGTFYSATPSSRGGAVRFLTKEFPELTGASAVTSGDTEMMRDTINPLGLSSGKLDLYASSAATVVDTLQVPLIYNVAAGVFVGKILPTGIPYKLDSIKATGAPNVILTLGDNVNIYSRSKNPVKAPMASCAYSNLEELWIVVNMPTNPANGDPLIPLENVGAGQVGNFALQFRQDPQLPAVIDATEAQGVMPSGVDILTRGFIPIVFTQFLVSYQRRRGTAVNIEAARQEILAYVNKLASPSSYSDTRVADSMFAAGASDVTGITIQARVQWSIANKFLPVSAPSLLSNYSGAVAAAKTAQDITIASTKDLKITFVDTDMGTPAACFESIGIRNAILLLDVENLAFSES